MGKGPNTAQKRSLPDAESGKPRPRTLIALVAAAIAIAGAAAVLAAIASLHWRYWLDSPLMAYAGYLVSHGAVPYRDFFDINMPGTYAAMSLMGTLFGWDDLGFRIFDLFCLAGLSLATYVWLRPAGRAPALAAATAFALWYLNAGVSMSVQREYLALIPLAFMLALNRAGAPPASLPRTALSGALAGLSVLIKPQFALLILPLLLYVAATSRAPISRWRRLAAFGIGAAVPISATAVCLLVTGALGPFLDMAWHYWPLYTSMTGAHVSVTGFDRILYIMHGTGRLFLSSYTPLAVLGLLVFAWNSEDRRLSWLFAGLLIAALIYPAAGGQFWFYHRIPFYYFAICAASLATGQVVRPRFTAYLGMLAVVVMLLYNTFVMMEKVSVSAQHGVEIRDEEERNATPDAIARFLRTHLRKGETVQPLDWTGGAVHAMLMARAPLAMYDFHFYHHVTDPYIRELRRRFIAELRAARPAIIIDVFGKDKPWPGGTDASREFPALQAFLHDHYTIVSGTSTYRILKRRDLPNERDSLHRPGGDISRRQQ